MVVEAEVALGLKLSSWTELPVIAPEFEPVPVEVNLGADNDLEIRMTLNIFITVSFVLICLCFLPSTRRTLIWKSLITG